MLGRLLSPLTALLLVVGACNAINGSGDLVEGVPGGTGGTLPDGGRPAHGASNGPSPAEASGEEAGASDAAFIDDAGIDPKLASCGTNDVCLPMSDGWTPAVSLVAGGLLGCPSAWPQRSNYETADNGACTCTCKPSGGSCAGSVDAKTGVACATDAPGMLTLSGGCTSQAVTLPSPLALSPLPSGTTPTSCTATADARVGRPQAAVICTGAVPVPPTTNPCAGGEQCLPQGGAVTGGLVCIVHDGNIACPSKLPLRSVVGAKVMDARSCSATCSCGTNNCADGTLEVFAATGCSTSLSKLNVDSVCTPVGPLTVASYRYTPGSGCAVTQAQQVLGSVTYTAPHTLCCASGG